MKTSGNKSHNNPKLKKMWEKGKTIGYFYDYVKIMKIYTNHNKKNAIIIICTYFSVKLIFILHFLFLLAL